MGWLSKGMPKEEKRWPNSLAWFGCQMVPSIRQVSIHHPLGFNWHPLEGAGSPRSLDLVFWSPPSVHKKRLQNWVSTHISFTFEVFFIGMCNKQGEEAHLCCLKHHTTSMITLGWLHPSDFYGMKWPPYGTFPKARLLVKYQTVSNTSTPFQQYAQSEPGDHHLWGEGLYVSW